MTVRIAYKDNTKIEACNWSSDKDGRCISFKRLGYVGNGNVTEICACTKFASEHYGHVLMNDHSKCQWFQREARPDDDVG